MKKFIRENPTIAFGLGLPLLLVLVFLLISGIPTLVVDDPQHDVLYATQYYGYPNGIQISVIDQKVQVIFHGTVMVNQKPKIWRYHPKTGAIREIAYVLPSGLAQANQVGANTDAVTKTIEIDVPDLVGLTVDSSSIAPDGYEFRIGRDRYSDNVFGGIFYSSRYRNEAVLTKKGRKVGLPNPDTQYYSYNTHFIGWVVSQ